MTLNDYVSTDTKIGLIAWAICAIPDFVLHLLGRYHTMEFPKVFMQTGQIIFWCIGGLVGLITLFEWLKNNVEWFKKFKK